METRPEPPLTDAFKHRNVAVYRSPETTMSALIGGKMRLKTRVAVAAVAAGTLLASAACTSSSNGGSAPKNVEVFTWWADGGEKAGLDGLVSQFNKDCSQFNFVNGAVAGGAGSNAKTVLAQRLTQNDPPDTFQAHAGAEL